MAINMGIYALVKDGLVINTILWDGNDFYFGRSVKVIQITEGVSVSIGYFHRENYFLSAPLTEEQIEEKRGRTVYSNMAVKLELISQAAAAIALFQDAADLGEPNKAEMESLKLWSLYRVALNRIDANSTDSIKWPEQSSL